MYIRLLYIFVCIFNVLETSEGTDTATSSNVRDEVTGDELMEVRSPNDSILRDFATIVLDYSAGLLQRTTPLIPA